MPPRKTPVLICCGVYLTLHLAAHVSAELFEMSPGVSIWYAPAGLALSFLVLMGLRYTPVVLLANLGAALWFSELPTSWAEFAFPLMNTLNYAAVAWIARRYMRGLLLPGSPSELGRFLAIILAAPVPLAVAGTALLIALGVVPPPGLAQSAFEWWVGDVSGILTVVPVAMVHAQPLLCPQFQYNWVRQAPKTPPLITLLQACILGACLLLVFCLEPLRRYNAYHLCLLPLVWICLRHGLKGATIAALAITIVGLICMHFIGHSAFLTPSFLLFELAVACVGLGLGSVVTQREIAEQKLRASQADARRLLELLEATPDLVAVTDDTLRILQANAALVRLAARTGTGPVTALTLPTVLKTDIGAAAWREALAGASSKGIWHGELAVTGEEGDPVPMSVVVVAHRKEQPAPLFSFVLRNIARQKLAETERVENERKLLQLQKLESLGLLAGGIAHDFNNLLTPLMGYASLAQLELPPESPVQESMRKIEAATQRAAALCQQMLAYAGRSPLAFAEIDLSTLIEETSELLRLTAGKKRPVAFDLAKSLPRLTADPTQMRQLLLNLTMNASEAMADSSGAITLRTYERLIETVEDTKLFHGHALKPGNHVVIEVQDTGPGLTPQVRARLFEPFFSTKSAGHGLGLAAVLGIAKSHNGSIEVVSTAPRGTTFRLYFPALARPSGRPLPAARVPSQWRGSGTVLVVDDEDEIRRVLVRTLETCGFATKQAADGAEAVELVSEAPANAFRFVLLDLTMPRMDGEEAFHEIHRLRPALPVVVMSGYSEKLSLDRFTEAKPTAFLPKPFDIRILRECLQELPGFAEQSGGSTDGSSV